MISVLPIEPLLLGIKWLDPEWLQHQYGSAFIWLALVMVFVECGLFFPFLPGDTLLFALGLFIAGSNATGYSVIGIHNEPVELLIAMALLMVAAFAGNVVGYEIGRKIGPPLYERDGRIIKRQYLDKTSAFFDKHGSKALVIGRFAPFVRTYITVVAGVTMMDRRKFLTWSAVGAALWVISITLLGYFLGAAFPWLGENIDYVTIVILAFSVVPLGYEWVKKRMEGRRRAARVEVASAEPESQATSERAAT